MSEELIIQGIDDTEGLEEINSEHSDTPVIDITKPATDKRARFVLWEVQDGEAYKLKLSSAAICKLEGKFKKNLLLVLTEPGVPAVSVMLTVIQAATLQYHHGLKFRKIQEAYDRYVSAGGDQMKLMTDIIMPLMGVSGFFTADQMEDLTEEMNTNL